MQIFIPKKLSAGRLAMSIALLIPVMASCASEMVKAPADTSPTPAQNAPAIAPTTPPTISASPTNKTSGETSGSIVDVASANPSLKMMTAAIQAAGLTSTLQGKGPYTVFAPTDQAFASVPAATRQRVLQPENRAILTRILTYHVVPGEITSSQLKSGDVKTVEGKTIDIQVKSAQVTVNEAKVTQPDIRANNGVIHVVDRIIIPPDVNL
ncbi:fasciclin domain-containing protein [Phormidesmis sp. 146-33]